MFRQLVIFFFILCPFINNGQSIYFDKTYDKDFLTERCTNILALPNNKYAFYSSGYNFITHSETRLNYYVINDTGGVEFEDFMQDDSGRYEVGYICKTSDGNIANFYAYSVPPRQLTFQLSKVTPENNLLWHKSFGSDTMINSPQHLIETADKGFLLVGQTYYSAASGINDGDMAAIKTDSLGNVQWSKTFGGTNYDAGLSSLSTPDGGFLILGMTRSFGAGQRDAYLVKTDSLGNQEWQKTYGTQANESGWGIIALNDGNYLMGGGGGYPGGSGWAKLIKINGLGTVIWQKTYNYQGANDSYIYWPTELTDGSIVAEGLTTTAGESNAGWLLKTDSNGNEIWQQKYNYNNYVDLFYNVLPTEDEGFLLSGWCLNPASNNTTDAWLLKVDSLGCPYPNCTVGIEEESKKVAFNLWPNPAVNELHIELHGSARTNLVLHDAIGRVVLQKTLNEKENTVELSTIPAGIYNAEIDIGKEKYFKKLIIAKE